MTTNNALPSEEIQEGNKLIAAFMGTKELTGDFTVIETNCEFMHERRGTWDDVKYHSSWDWLMPVVEKIEKMGFDSRIHGNDSDGGFLCDFVDAENKEAACKTSYTSKIGAVYLAVIDFIKWHNEQKSKP